MVKLLRSMNIEQRIRNPSELGEISWPYLIAEAGVNHEGSLDTAYRLIDEAKEGGADKAQQLFNSSSEMKSDYKQGVVPNKSAGGNYSKAWRFSGFVSWTFQYHPSRTYSLSGLCA